MRFFQQLLTLFAQRPTPHPVKYKNQILRAPLYYTTCASSTSIAHRIKSLQHTQPSPFRLALLDLSGLLNPRHLTTSHPMWFLRNDPTNLHTITLYLQHHRAFSALILVLETTRETPRYRAALAQLWCSYSTLPATCPWLVFFIGDPQIRDPFLQTLRSHSRAQPFPDNNTHARNR